MGEIGPLKKLPNFPFRKGGDLGGKEEVTGGRRSCPSTDLSLFHWTIFFATRTSFLVNFLFLFIKRFKSVVCCWAQRADA